MCDKSNNTKNVIKLVYGDSLSIVCEYNNVIICMDENKQFVIFNVDNGNKIVENVVLAGMNDKYIILTDMSTHSLDMKTYVYDTINLEIVFESDRHMLEYYGLLCDDENVWNIGHDNGRICTLDGKLLYTSEYQGGIRLNDITPLDKPIDNPDFKTLYVDSSSKVFLMEELYYTHTKMTHYSICEYNENKKEFKIVKRFKQDDDVNMLTENILLVNKYSIKSTENNIIQIINK